MCAERLVDRHLVLDAHCDSLVRRWKRDDPLDLADVDPIYQIDLPRLRQGGVDCLFTFVGDTVLDPFLGSCSTLIACLAANRKGIGVEIDRGYCEIARQRLMAKGEKCQ